MSIMLLMALNAGREVVGSSASLGQAKAAMLRLDGSGRLCTATFVFGGCGCGFTCKLEYESLHSSLELGACCAYI
jgi:hypothetical protein